MTKIFFFFLASLFFLNEFIGIYFLFMLFFLSLMYHYLLGSVITSDLFGMLGVNCYSYYMVMLSMFILSIVLLVFYDYLLSLIFVAMFLMMLIMFMSIDLFYFFIFFESSIIPMFFLILLYGHGSSRHISAKYMFVYTLLGSLPSLLIAFYLYNTLGSMSIEYISYTGYLLDDWFSFSLILMFMVKVPAVFVHIWLPKAHVDAPVYGSMVLASIMLKMGGYGIILFFHISVISTFLSDLFIVTSIVGSMFLSMICLYQVDQKVLVAYSSIVHMGAMLGGFFSETEIGWKGGLIMMISHGVISSYMFYFVNTIYFITGSRLLMFSGGIYSIYPVVGVLWLFILVSNLGGPPFFSIYSEVFLITSVVGYMFYFWIYFVFIIFFVSCFIISMYVGIMGGPTFYINVCADSILFYYCSMYHFFFLLYGSMYMVYMF